MIERHVYYNGFYFKWILQRPILTVGRNLAGNNNFKTLEYGVVLGVF